MGSLLLEFGTILQMSSIGLLIEFTASSIIVLLIRYQPSPVGISREYSDLDGSYASYEDVADCQDLFEYREEGRPRLVLLPPDDDSVSGRFGYGETKYEPNFYPSPGRPDDCVTIQTQYSDRNSRQTTEFQRCPESGTYQSFFVGSPASLPAPPARSFVNKFKKKEADSSQVSVTVYGERDSLKSAAFDSNGFTQHKCYGTAKSSHGDVTKYSASGHSSITEGNNNCSKRKVKAAADSVDSKSKELGDSRDLMVRKMSLTCSLRGSGTEVTLQRSFSAASSLVNLGNYEADEASWRRARYYLLVYIAASTCLAITTQLWPTRPAPHSVLQGAAGGHFNTVNAVKVHSHPHTPGQDTRESFRHEQHQKAFDSRIEEGGQYEVVMSSGSSISCVDPEPSPGLSGAWWAVLLLCSSLVVMLVSGLCIAKQPQNRTPLHFKTPYVPLVPLLALSGNMLLLGALPVISWSRFAVWTLAGKAPSVLHND